jgi:hypothetical protein
MPLCKTQTGKFNFKCCHVHYMDAFNNYLSYSLNMLFQNQNLCPLACCYLITNKSEKLLLGSNSAVKICCFLYDNTPHQMLLSSKHCCYFIFWRPWVRIFAHWLPNLTGSLCLSSVSLGNSGKVPGHDCFLPRVFQFNTGIQYHVTIWHYTIWATESSVR